MTAEHYRKLERMYLGAPLNELYRPTIRIETGRCEIALPVQQRFFHAAEALHGSAVFKALDDAAFFAANSLVEDVFVLTASFNLYFLRPVSSGHLHAVGEVVSRSKRVIIAEAIARDDQGREVARGSGSFMPSALPLTPEMGYR